MNQLLIFVDGTLSIIRYTSEAANMAGVNAAGNSVNQMVNQAGAGGIAGAGFDPAKLIASETFDLEIFQKYMSGVTASTISVGKLIDCRFTRKGGAINKRGILVEQFSFNAILMNNDSVSANDVGHSGDTDMAP
jgi:hypothetical protein